MSVEIIEQFLTDVVSKLKDENLLIIDSNVSGIVDLLLEDKDLNLKKVYEVNEKL